MNEKLTTVIDEMVREKTFSLEAVEAIKKLRDRAEKLEAQLGAAIATHDNSQRQLNAANAELERLKAGERVVAARELAAAKREEAITKLEKDAAVAQAQSAVWSESFHAIFANRIVRENVQHSVPVSYIPPGASYPNTTIHQHREDIEREEK